MKYFETSGGGRGLYYESQYTNMKLKFPLLLALLAAAGLVAADAPAGDAPKADAPKGEGKGEGRGKGGPNIPGVSPEDMKKYQIARKAAAESPEVKAAHEAAKAARAKGDEAKDEDAKKAAREEGMKAYQAVREATAVAILKADPSLAEVLKKVEEAMKNRQPGPGGKGGEGKGGEGKGKLGGAGKSKGKGEKPADAK